MQTNNTTAATETNEFKPGQKVRNRYGQTRTVLYQASDCQVYVEEEGCNWYHPANLFLVK